MWIDNVAEVSIGSNVSLSQGYILLTGSHKYMKAGFDFLLQRQPRHAVKSRVITQYLSISLKNLHIKIYTGIFYLPH